MRSRLHCQVIPSLRPRPSKQSDAACESEQFVPILKLALVCEGSKTTYEIDNYDLYNIFERFGKLENIVQGNESTYFIVFFALEDAKTAYSSLNGTVIEELKARLELKLCSIEAKRTETVEQVYLAQLEGVLVVLVALLLG